MRAPVDYVRPGSAEEALGLAADPDALVVAGGTEVVSWLGHGLVRANRLVDLGRLPLTAIERRGGELRIGALARLVDVARHAEVRRAAPALVRAIELAASPQLRHMASLGGNLLQETRCPYFRAGTPVPCNRRAPGTGCPVQQGGHQREAAILGANAACVATHPSDPAVALVALDARVAVLGTSGEREVAVETLLSTSPAQGRPLARGELLTAIVIPTGGPEPARSAYFKVRDRAAFDFALVSAAASVEITADRLASVRLALGGVAPAPWRCRLAEAGLAGLRVEREAVRAAVQAELARATPLPGSRFKVRLAVEVATEAVLAAAEAAP